MGASFKPEREVLSSMKDCPTHGLEYYSRCWVKDMMYTMIRQTHTYGTYIHRQVHTHSTCS